MRPRGNVALLLGYVRALCPPLLCIVRPGRTIVILAGKCLSRCFFEWELLIAVCDPIRECLSRHNACSQIQRFPVFLHVRCVRQTTPAYRPLAHIAPVRFRLRVPIALYAWCVCACAWHVACWSHTARPRTRGVAVGLALALLVRCSLVSRCGAACVCRHDVPSRVVCGTPRRACRPHRTGARSCDNEIACVAWTRGPPSPCDCAGLLTAVRHLGRTPTGLCGNR